MTHQATSATAGAGPADGAAGIDPSYRSVSTVALVALLLGIVSPVALLSPLLIALPCGALVVSFVALRKIASSDGALAGRSAALVGMTLAALSLSAVLTRDAVRRHRLNRQAQLAADQWLKTVQQGELRRAFLLTLPPAQRSAASEGLDDPASEFATGFASFQGGADLAPLLAPSAVEDFHYLNGGAPADAGYGRLRLAQQYEVAVEGRDEPLRYSIFLERTAPTEAAPAEWRVTHAQRVGERA